MSLSNPRTGRRPARRIAAGTSIAVVALSLLSACGSGDDAAGSGASGEDAPPAASEFGLETDAAVAELVPAEFKDAPAVNAIYNDAPPQNFLEDGKLVGVQVDLNQALSEIMGIEFKVESIGNFDTIIPGLQNGRYDVAMSDFGVTKEREEVIDFVYMFDLGTSFAVKEGSDLTFEEGTDLCGHSVGLLAGSYFLPQADALSADCEAAGEEPLAVQSFPTQSAAILAVKNNRVEAYGASSDQIGYLADQDGAGLSAQPFVYEAIPQGIGFPKGSELAPAVEAGLKALIEEGPYQEILDKWGIGSAAITADEVTTSPVPGAS